jgi:prolyl-tRNA editing enzyme YbaK/EbsC (Cys-tRNA(Pro) deacylase)
MSTPLSPGAQRVQAALARLGFDYQVVHLAQTTRSAPEAAQAVGCRVEQIAKSLVFRTTGGQRPLLVIASGANRVDERRLATLAGEPVERPDADYVRQRTGFPIGGVAPVGLAEPLDIFIDEDLLAHDEIWAAAGTPNAVFRLPSSDLPRLTGGRVVAIASTPPAV